MKRKIYVMDTTLRDGEQVPGARLNDEEKVIIAKQLNKLNVDCIEAGFAASSIGDFNAIISVAKEFSKGGPVITALARAVKSDIEAVYNSVKYAYRPMIHIVLGSSNVHVKKKFNRTIDQVISMGVESVKYAKTFLKDVQYSTEDASRTDFEDLWKTVKAVVEAGATIINIPDTVGYAVPEEFGEIIRKINYRIKNLNPNVILSVHCHNDLGMATVNTLSAVKNGADRVECTINGIGERAGNASLEEVVMGIKSRADFYNAETSIFTRELKYTSNLVSKMMGLGVQVNKAIVGENAFAHSSGIHQDGLLKSRDVYEIIKPEEIGLNDMELVLTARSGRHAIMDAVSKFGVILENDKMINDFCEKFLDFADIKKEIYYNELYDFVKNYAHTNNIEISKFDLLKIKRIQGFTNDDFHSTSIELCKGEKVYIDSAIGDNIVNSIKNSIDRVVGDDYKIVDFNAFVVKNRTRVSMKIKYKNSEICTRASDKHLIYAIANCYINGINRMIIEKEIKIKSNAM